VLVQEMRELCTLRGLRTLVPALYARFRSTGSNPLAE